MIEPAGTEFLLGLLDYVFNGRPHKERTLLLASPRPRRGKESVHGEKKSVHIPRVFPFIYKAVNQISV